MRSGPYWFSIVLLDKYTCVLDVHTNAHLSNSTIHVLGKILRVLKWSSLHWIVLQMYKFLNQWNLQIYGILQFAKLFVYVFTTGIFLDGPLLEGCEQCKHSHVLWRVPRWIWTDGDWQWQRKHVFVWNPRAKSFGLRKWPGFNHHWGTINLTHILFYLRWLTLC